MANNRYYYTNGSLQKEVYFFDFITWGYNAEKAASSLSKGSHVLVSGELRQNSYFTKEGNRRNSIYILALEIKSLSKKTLDNNSSNELANNQEISNIIEENMEQAF